jgi:hypothetical protein
MNLRARLCRAYINTCAPLRPPGFGPVSRSLGVVEVVNRVSQNLFGPHLKMKLVIRCVFIGSLDVERSVFHVKH